MSIYIYLYVFIHYLHRSNKTLDHIGICGEKGRSRLHSLLSNKTLWVHNISFVLWFFFFHSLFVCNSNDNVWLYRWIILIKFHNFDFKIKLQQTRDWLVLTASLEQCVWWMMKNFDLPTLETDMFFVVDFDYLY